MVVHMVSRLTSKTIFLEGLDDIDLTLEHQESIEEHERLRKRIILGRALLINIISFIGMELMEFSNNLLVLILAIIVDAVAGDPRWFYSRIPHLIVVIGHQIELSIDFLTEPTTHQLLQIISVISILSSVSLVDRLVDCLVLQSSELWSCSPSSIVSIFLA